MSELDDHRRIAEIKKKARQRGRISLRCPDCRHYLTGIVSARGDFVFKTGEHGYLYCTWPDCIRDSGRVKVREAVRGRGPQDGSACCRSQKARRQRELARS